MASLIRPTMHLTEVYELLIATYGEPKNEPDSDPLGGLIATILSQHTSDINSERAYKQLITTIPIMGSSTRCTNGEGCRSDKVWRAGKY